MFMVGDLVKCVNTKGYIPSIHGKALKEGKFYIIEEVLFTEDMVKVQGVEAYLSVFRFVLVTPTVTLRPGDYVRLNDISSQEELDEVVRCFVRAGADNSWMDGVNRIRLERNRVVGWDLNGKVNGWVPNGYARTDGEPWCKRRLLVKQVFRATNAREVEKPKTNSYLGVNEDRVWVAMTFEEVPNGSRFRVNELSATRTKVICPKVWTGSTFEKKHFFFGSTPEELSSLPMTKEVFVDIKSLENQFDD